MPSQTVDREQAVMHALLRAPDQIPVSRPCADLRKQLFHQLEGSFQLGHHRSAVLDALRMGAVPACVAAILALGVSVITFRMTNTPPLKSIAATGISNNGAPTSGKSPKHGSAELGLNSPAAGTSEFGNRPVRASDLSSPITYPLNRLTGRDTRDSNEASIQSSPLMRQANALQQAGPLIQKAILERLPPMPERPK